MTTRALNVVYRLRPALQLKRRWLSESRKRSDPEKKITLFASELGSCVRMNQYTPVHEAVEKLWQKHFPSSFNAARDTLHEQDIVVLTREEKVQEVIAARGFEEPVSRLKEEASQRVTNTETLSVMTEGSAMLAKRVDEQAAATAHKELQRTSSDAATQRAVEAELKSDKPLLQKLPRIQKSIEHLPSAEQEAVIRPLKSGIEDQKTLEKEVRKTVYTDFGTRTERSALDIFAERYDRQVRTEDKFYITPVGETSTGQVVQIGGKVDGFAMARESAEEELVEIKNRMHRAFECMPPYEQVQTQVLLEVTKKRRGVLVQSLKREGAHLLEVIPFQRREDLLHKIIIPRAIAFSRTLLRLHQDPELAVRFLRAGDDGSALKAQIVMELLQDSSREQARRA